MLGGPDVPVGALDERRAMPIVFDGVLHAVQAALRRGIAILPGSDQTVRRGIPCALWRPLEARPASCAEECNKERLLSRRVRAFPASPCP